MKYIWTFCIFLSFVQTHQAQRANYELVWSDEFEGNGAIDPEKWHHQTQIPNGQSWYNGEIQHYTDRIENSFVSEGTLKIMAKRETYTNQGVTKDFTSARLNSKFAFTYGRVVVRAKLPFGIGTWPAIWMLGKNIIEPGAYFTSTHGTTSWPACGEIDIMEQTGQDKTGVGATVHFPNSSGTGPSFITASRSIENSEEYHVYTVEWRQDEIIFAADNEIYHRVTNVSELPFNSDFFLILNVAMGGTLGGLVDPNFTSDQMVVDYVRVYQ